MRGRRVVPLVVMLLLAACGGGNGVVAASSGASSPSGQATGGAAPSPAKSAADNASPACGLIDVAYYNQLTGASVPAPAPSSPPGTICSYEYLSPTSSQRWSATVERPGSGKPCSGSATADDIYFVVTPKTTARAWRVVDEGVVNGTICNSNYLVQLSIVHVPGWTLGKMRDHLLALGKRVESTKVG